MLYFFAMKEEQWATHSDQQYMAINLQHRKQGRPGKSDEK